MQSYDRWDDWEWEEAAREIHRQNGSSRHNKRFQRHQNIWPFLGRWTGSQKRVLLTALLFLAIIFASQGTDSLSQSVYSFYRFGMEHGDYYPAMNVMAKEAIGLSGQEALPIQAEVRPLFYPPVGGKVRVMFDGSGFSGEKSMGVEIETELGTPVLCPEKGVVIEVAEKMPLGRFVRINLGNGWEALLGNLADVKVAVGDPVDLGDALGTVGLTSAREKPWLYFQLTKNGKVVDPMPYFLQ